MFTRLILFLTLIVLTFTYQSTRYETGLENSIHFAPQPYHILHSQNNIPRSVDVTVKFKDKFDYVPKVGAACSLLDWQGGTPAGFRFNIESVSNTEFVLRYTAVTAQQLYAVFVNWMAIFDPRIHVQFFETTELGPLLTGEGDRNVELQIPIQGRTFSSAPTAISFLAGVSFSKPNNIIFERVKTTTEKSVTVNVNTFWLTNVQMVRLCIVMGERDSIWGIEGGFRVPDRNHAWVSRGASESVVPSSVDIPGTWNSGDRGVLYGFGGFDSDQTGRNTRTFVRNFKFNGNKGEVELGTWWDSIQYQISYFVLIYRKDPKFKVFDPDCAEIFASCDFEGDSISVCDRILSLPDEGWNKPIRSIKVPSQKVLKLYNQEKLKGSVSIFRKDESCIKDMTFSFAQVSLEKY